MAVKTSRQRRHIATCRRGPKGSAALFAQIYKHGSEPLQQDPSGPRNIDCDVMLKQVFYKKRKDMFAGALAAPSTTFILKSTKGLHKTF